MLFSSLILLNSFLKKSSPGAKSQFFQFLSPQTLQSLEKTYIPKKDIDLKNFTLNALTEDIHYSWFIPIFQSYSKKEQSLFLEILDEQRKEKLAKILKRKKEEKTLSLFAQDFFKEELFKQVVQKEDLLPRDYLPDSPLNILLYLSKHEITKLIDFLSLYDLALTMPKIVQTTVLKKVYSYLSEEKLKFLKSKSSYKEPFSFPRLKIENALEDRATFNLFLHKRGLNRFAKALDLENKSFLWHLCHKLDIGRGKTIENLLKEEIKIQKKVTETITSNIIDVLSIIRKKTKKEALS